MPVVFVHGVATRSGDGYQRAVAAREELIRRLLVEPMSKIDPRWSGMRVTSPYWGDLAVRHYWAQATVPRVHLLESLGPGDDVTAADLELAALLAGQKGARSEATEGAATLRDAWVADPYRAVEALLAPVVHSERSVLRPGDVTADEPHTRERMLGEIDGRVLAAGALVAADPDVGSAVHAAASDDAALRIVTAAIADRAGQNRSESDVPATSPASERPETENPEPEILGSGWLDRLTSGVGELVFRARGAPARAATLALLDRYRDALHHHVALFMGDAFVYLLRRGETDAPGPIVERIRQAIADAPRTHPDEPLVVITHSMGGNIFYDLMTAYAPDLHVDLWVSAGGQVGQFEEMKIFKASSLTDPPAPPLPPKVAPLGGRVSTWLNVYDPADILGFLVEPVFTDPSPDVRIKDLEFGSGVSALQAHGAYFTRPTFYRLLTGELGATS